MKGGLRGDSQGGLTAYVVIALLEANVSNTVGNKLGDRSHVLLWFKTKVYF